MLDSACIGRRGLIWRRRPAVRRPPDGEQGPGRSSRQGLYERIVEEAGRLRGSCAHASPAASRAVVGRVGPLRSLSGRDRSPGRESPAPGARPREQDRATDRRHPPAEPSANELRLGRKATFGSPVNARPGGALLIHEGEPPRPGHTRRHAPRSALAGAASVDPSGSPLHFSVPAGAGARREGGLRPLMGTKQSLSNNYAVHYSGD